MLGLFTQWSGNTLISYYLGDAPGEYWRDSHKDFRGCWGEVEGTTELDCAAG